MSGCISLFINILAVGFIIGMFVGIEIYEYVEGVKMKDWMKTIIVFLLGILIGHVIGQLLW